MKEKINFIGIILGISVAIFILLTIGCMSCGMDFSDITEEQRLEVLRRLGGVEGLTIMYLTYTVLPSSLIIVLFYAWLNKKKEAYE